MTLQPRTHAAIDDFVRRTRPAIFVRRADRVLMIRPDKTLRINETATEILGDLYEARSEGAAAVLPRLAQRLGATPDRLLQDTGVLIDTVDAIFREDFSPRAGLRMAPYVHGALAYPTLAEIAVTYGCQNRCIFCYASSPCRGEGERAMTLDEICRVMGRIWHEAHVPSLSFTGGEATLRPDLPELVRHGADLGFRVNLISNGVRLADPDLAARLVDHGLASAQLSLEAGTARLHDAITGREGSFEATTRGVRNLQKLGVHVHTNTTLCAANLDEADDLVRFAARELGLKTISMNMVIRTGQALEGEDPGVPYERVGRRLPALVELAEAEGIRLVWYSPIPYCIFNPVLHGLGAKSCACVHGILSVDPQGRLLPCSSFEQGLGSLLDEDFPTLFARAEARYWRDREFLPPPCRDCPDGDVCAGACPLYWDAAGSFAELPRPGSDDPALYEAWRRDRARGGAFGVGIHADRLERGA